MPFSLALRIQQIQSTRLYLRTLQHSNKSILPSSLRSPTFARRQITCAAVLRTQSATVPWFVDVDEKLPLPGHFERTTAPSARSRAAAAPTVPEDAPEILKELQAELTQSPHLDISRLLVRRAIPPPAEPLPARLPHGRRRRGGTNAGESAYDTPGGLWNWFIFAQVKEGTESRGALGSVVRLVRRTLLARTPPVTLPPKSRRQMENGWAMVDAGNFAVHILSKEAREKYFTDVVTSP